MRSEEQGNCIVIKVAQHFAGPIVKETMAGVLERFKSGKTVAFVFDFHVSELIDSSGIGALVSLAKEFHFGGGQLILRNLNDDLLQLFIDTGLDKIFSIEHRGDVRKAEIDLFENAVDVRLTIKKELVADLCVFIMCGVMNHPIGSSYFKQQFLLSLATHKKFILDMEELTFFDSLSLSAVLAMNNLLKGTGGGLRICGANYIVNDLFTTLNIDSIIPVFNTRGEALSGWDSHYV